MRINRLTYKPSIRIGIIGAGCAGLTAAEELHDLGYKNITIIDAKNRVGGK
ncbi:NAD(P)-binding protein, partial [Nostoc sp. FACHB-133]|uniref:NAD(P)-binding protein n=1 Tax=Nostoc sp. FACHB-133 TaxID=2692835 RepID=UPI0016824820